MSADLFALFGDAPQTTSTPQHHQKQSNAASAAPNPPTSDPFSFLSSSTAAPHPPSQTQPQISQHQQSTPWPPFQQPASAHPGAWFASPVSEPQASNDGWEPFGASGDLASLQSLPMSFQTSQPPAPAEQEDDDGWGDFEVASPTPPPPQPVAALSTSSNLPRARVTRASTIDMMTNKLVDLGLETSAPEPWQLQPQWEEKDSRKPAPAKPAHNPNPDVLFDADFEADNPVAEDDDFGDFETGTPAAVVPPQRAPAKSALDLLSLDSTPASAPPQPKKQPPGLSLSSAALQANPASYPEAPKSPYGSFLERKPETVKQLQVQPPTVTKALKDANEASPSPVTAWPAVEADGFGNQWEEFKDLPDTTKPATAPKSKLSTAVGSTSGWDWQDWGAAESQPAPAVTTATPAAAEAKPGPPPTNIPPPATLLSLFPQLLDLASASLLKPLLTLSPSSPAYQRVLASEATLTFIKGYLALATVAARLIAGRKHRWHRDKFLAQGMAISAAPAAGAGGQRGMKLTSVDKSQAVHEDREATEVVGTWKRQVGRLRGVLAGVNAAQGVALRVPEIATAMAVSTAKGVPTAQKACVVCGLKRDERVAKVDVDVEDSFGEWWVDFWGHRECRNFWVGHEKELRQL